MLNIILVILLAALIAWAILRAARRARRGSACCGEREAAEKRSVVADRNRAHYPHVVKLSIGGMTCENCARRVENALNALDGVWATVDIGSHTATVRSKQPVERRQLADAVRAAGYVVME